MPTSEQVEAREREVREWYAEAYYRFQTFEQRFYAHLQAALANAGLDEVQVETRTKSVASLVTKAAAVEDERFRYDQPREQIKDYVGARIIVPLSTDVVPVSRLLDDTYVVDERTTRRKDDEEDVPGYQSLHLLVRLTEDDRRDVSLKDLGDITVEIQVRTILQHAWAALQHDLMYKTDRQPTVDVRRRLVALAGLLELADHEFVQVRREHGGETSVAGSIEQQLLPGEFTAEGLREVVASLVGDDEGTGDPAWYSELATVLAELGIDDEDALRLRLREWADRGPAVARTVRAREPWATGPYVTDLLLRLAMRDGYLDARGGEADDIRRTTWLEDLDRVAASL